MDWCLYDNGLRHERVNVKILTRFNPLVPFYNPWKHQKASGFLISGGIEKDQWKIG